MSYASDHAGALADLTAAGTAVTFTKVDPGTQDAATGLYTGDTVTTVTGSAIQVKGKPETYAALGLIESDAPTLLLAPTTYGAKPSLGATVAWGGKSLTVASVEPIAPDGTAILCRVVVQR